MARNQRVLKMQSIDDVDDADTILEGEIVEDGVGGIWEDLFSAGQKVAKDAIKAGSGTASDQLEKALRSSEFNKVLVAVEQKAREGVKKEVASNLPALAMFTLAGGVIGGAIAQTGGTVAKAAVIGVAIWMGYGLATKK